MAEFQLRYLVQWLQAKAPQAKDPRVRIFRLLYRSATIDPHTLKVIKDKNGLLTVQASLNYATPDLNALKNKKIKLLRKTAQVQVSLEPFIQGRVFLLQNRGVFSVSLEEALVLWNLYLIFSDASKFKAFQTLIKEGT